MTPLNRALWYPIILAQPVISNAVSMLHAHGSNLSYMIRGVGRVETVIPADRQPDYLWRDGYVTLLNVWMIEMGNKLAHKFYTFPLLTDRLQLNRLTEIYGKTFQGQPVENFSSITNYHPVMNSLRRRMGGNNIRAESFLQIPQMVAEDLADKTMTNAERAQTNLVVGHLKRIMNYPQYVDTLELPAIERYAVQMGLDSQSRLQSIEKAIALGEQKVKTPYSLRLARRLGFGNLPAIGDRLAQLEQDHQNDWLKKSLDSIDKVRLKISQLAEHESYPLEKTLVDPIRQQLDTVHTQLQHFMDNGTLVPTEQIHDVLETAMGTLKSAEGKLWRGVFDEGVSKDVLARVRHYLEEGASSKTVLNQMTKIADTAFTPKMLVGTAILFALYGTASNYFDTHYLQRWEEKTYEKYGRLRFAVHAMYAGFVPGVLTFVGLINDELPVLGKYLKRHYAGQYTLAGIASFGVMCATAYALTKSALKKEKPLPPHEQAKHRKKPTEPAPPAAGATPAEKALPSLPGLQPKNTLAKDGPPVVAGIAPLPLPSSTAGGGPQPNPFAQGAGVSPTVPFHPVFIEAMPLTAVAQLPGSRRSIEA